MKIQVAQKRLATALKKATHAISNKVNLPALTAVRLDATDGLVIAATDLAISIQVGIKPEDVQIQEKGCWAVPGKAFEDIVNSLNGDLTLACDGNRLLVKTGHSQFHLNAMPGDQFPALPGYAGLTFAEIPQENFWGGIEKVIGCASSDETRVNICSVRLDEKHWAATDGHKLAFYEHGLVEVIPLTLPADAISRALKNRGGADPIKFCRKDNQVHILDGDTLTTVKLLEVQYPDYHQVIPKNKMGTATVKREYLLTALQRVALVTDKAQKTVSLDFQVDSLKLSAETNEIGAAKDEIECTVEGEPCKLGFNAGYLISLLNHLKEETVKIQLNGKLSPILIQEGSLSYVVMPKRI